jgi:hypothetical protein
MGKRESTSLRRPAQRGIGWRVLAKMLPEPVDAIKESMATQGAITTLAKRMANSVSTGVLSPTPSKFREACFRLFLAKTFRN